VPLPRDAQTRVDGLRDTLAQLSAAHLAKAVTPNTGPLFIKHPDGSVYDTQGHELRGALPKSLVKGK
jgi:hypothetical protein